MRLGDLDALKAKITKCQIADFIAVQSVLDIINNAPTVKDEIKWHNLRENPNDKPTKVGWYCCKISSSDDLKMVFGQSEVMSGMYDAWLLVSCPY